jgi:hypothetical protein
MRDNGGDDIWRGSTFSAPRLLLCCGEFKEARAFSDSLRTRVGDTDPSARIGSCGRPVPRRPPSPAISRALCGDAIFQLFRRLSFFSALFSIAFSRKVFQRFSRFSRRKTQKGGKAYRNGTLRNFIALGKPVECRQARVADGELRRHTVRRRSPMKRVVELHSVQNTRI